MELRSLLRALRKNWWVVVATTAVALAIGGAITALTPAQYASAVTFFVRTPADQIGGAYQGDQFAQKRVNSYIELASSRRLAQSILDQTQLSLTPEQISSRITAEGDLNTVLLTVTVKDPNPQQSLDIAQALSTSFVNLVSELETPPGASKPTVSLDIVSSPTLEPRPVSPRPVFNLSLSLIAGLILGMALAILRDVMDSSVRRSEDARSASGGEVLATIPFDDTAKQSPLIVHGHSSSVRAEAFRQLRTNIDFVDVDNPVKVLSISSSVPDEGKSSTAANLAVAFAEANRKVLLIEADMRRPRVAEYLGLEGAVGLTNVLAGQAAVDDVLQVWGHGGLTVLPSGSIPPNPSELLASESMRDLLASLRQTFDLIIVDTPPLLPVTDGAIASAASDGALLVVRHGRTTRGQLESAAAALHAVDARLLGCVLNMTPVRGPEGEGYYGYGYESRQTQPSASPGSAEPGTQVSTEAGRHPVSAN